MTPLKARILSAEVVSAVLGRPVDTITPEDLLRFPYCVSCGMETEKNGVKTYWFMEAVREVTRIQDRAAQSRERSRLRNEQAAAAFYARQAATAQARPKATPVVQREPRESSKPAVKVEPKKVVACPRIDDPREPKLGRGRSSKPIPAATQERRRRARDNEAHPDNWRHLVQHDDQSASS